MLKIEKRIACAEALAVYNLLEPSVKKKIPKDLVKYFEENTSKNIKVAITDEIPLDMQQISEEGWVLIKHMYKYM